MNNMKHIQIDIVIIKNRKKRGNTCVKKYY
jgi:hypothetical protein